MSHFAVVGLPLELSNQDNLYLIHSEIEKTAWRSHWMDMIVASELVTFEVNMATAPPAGGRRTRSTVTRRGVA